MNAAHLDHVDEIHRCLNQAAAICNLLREQNGASKPEIDSAWAVEDLIHEAKDKFDDLMARLKAAAS
jgi:hypothetical protein